MPNHFHWLFHVRKIAIEVPVRSDGVTQSHPVTTTQSHPVIMTPVTKTRTLNNSIGLLLRSYTRAINKQENRSGALFREETKAKDGWEDPDMTLSHSDYGKVWKDWEIYGITCYNYIHNNPVKAKLVNAPEEWDFASAKDFAGLRNGSLCNKEMAKELLCLP